MQYFAHRTTRRLLTVHENVYKVLDFDKSNEEEFIHEMYINSTHWTEISEETYNKIIEIHTTKTICSH